LALGRYRPGGVRIGSYLEKVLPVPLRPHLMTSELALEYGSPSPADARSPHVDESSAFAVLARFLESGDARWLEQEMLDPCELA